MGNDRIIELRPIKLEIAKNFERSVYVGMIVEEVVTNHLDLMMKPSKFGVRKFQSEVPCGIEGFFKRRPERLQAAIKDALLKDLWPQMTPYVRLRRKS